MSDVLAQLDAVVSQLIASQERPTEESIRASISAMRISPIFANVTDDEAELLGTRARRACRDQHGDWCSHRRGRFQALAQ